jgi:hypothetical protein
VSTSPCASGLLLFRGPSAHIVLAFVNVFGAATMGVLIGFDKVYHFLPGFVLANVFAHAHLAAIGWASMMVVGVAYRLLPIDMNTNVFARRVEQERASQTTSVPEPLPNRTHVTRPCVPRPRCPHAVRPSLQGGNQG